DAARVEDGAGQRELEVHLERGPGEFRIGERRDRRAEVGSALVREREVIPEHGPRSREADEQRSLGRICAGPGEGAAQLVEVPAVRSTPFACRSRCELSRRGLDYVTNVLRVTQADRLLLAVRNQLLEAIGARGVQGPVEGTAGVAFAF